MHTKTTENKLKVVFHLYINKFIFLIIICNVNVIKKSIIFRYFYGFFLL